MQENGELTIRKANKFVQEYKVSLSLAEIRIVNYLIANIKSPKYDKEFRKFRFDIKEFCDTVYPDKKHGDAYRQLPDIIKKLADKSAWKEVPSTENPGTMKKVLIRWIERPEFEQGYVTLKLDPYLAPYLLQLENSFFKTKFQYTIEARSKYTIPLYELLKSWERVKDHKKKFEVGELRLYMDAMEKSKDNISEFKRRALDPALEEINEITDLNVRYTEIKKGRKVTHIEFTILRKKSAKEQEQLEGQEHFEDPESFERYTSSFRDMKEEESIESDELFYREHYGILMEEFPQFTGAEIAMLFTSSIKHLDLIGLPNEEKQFKIIEYITPMWKKIESTKERTKSTPFFRLLDMVENNY